MEVEGVGKGFGDIGRVGWMAYYRAALEGLAPSWLGFERVTCKDWAGVSRS